MFWLQLGLGKRDAGFAQRLGRQVNQQCTLVCMKSARVFVILVRFCKGIFSASRELKNSGRLDRHDCRPLRVRGFLPVFNLISHSFSEPALLWSERDLPAWVAS